MKNLKNTVLLYVTLFCVIIICIGIIIASRDTLTTASKILIGGSVLWLVLFSITNINRS